MIQNPAFTLVSATTSGAWDWTTNTSGPSTTTQYNAPMTVVTPTTDASGVTSVPYSRVSLPQPGDTAAFEPPITKISSDFPDEFAHYDPGASNYSDYDVYMFYVRHDPPLEMVADLALVNLRVTGTVTPTQQETYVPIRATNVVGRTLLEVIDFLIGSNATDAAFATGQLPPASLSLAADQLATFAANNAVDDLGGFGTCSPTKNGPIDSILADVSAAPSRADYYAGIAQLKSNPMVNYLLSGLTTSTGSSEDGCDQSAIHISWAAPAPATSAAPTTAPVPTFTLATTESSTAAAPSATTAATTAAPTSAPEPSTTTPATTVAAPTASAQPTAAATSQPSTSASTTVMAPVAGPTMCEPTVCGAIAVAADLLAITVPGFIAQPPSQAGAVVNGQPAGAGSPGVSVPVRATTQPKSSQPGAVTASASNVARPEASGAAGTASAQAPASATKRPTLATTGVNGLLGVLLFAAGALLAGLWLIRRERRLDS